MQRRRMIIGWWTESWSQSFQELPNVQVSCEESLRPVARRPAKYDDGGMLRIVFAKRIETPRRHRCARASAGRPPRSDDPRPEVALAGALGSETRAKEAHDGAGTTHDTSERWPPRAPGDGWLARILAAK
jgi:hypothetical protein